MKTVITRRAGIAFMVVALVLIFSGALDWGVDLVLYPWARANPPLLGTWSGTLTTGNGERLIVSLEMRRTVREREGFCVRCAQIEGNAATCDARGTVLRYRISGSPSDRRGTHLHLGAVPDRQPPPDGLELDVLSGTWDGGDGLDLQADFFWRRGAAAISSSDDKATQPVPLRMQRDAAKGFETMCGRLADPS
jgi:hypothetical protein